MKKILIPFILTSLPFLANAQAAFDALKTSESELRGTSRFQSMAGAFGALGGDLSTLSQNPAGIGVYRSSDVGVTLSLEGTSSKATGSSSDSKTTFNCNNFGYVGAIKLDSEVMPNFNWGFTYNRTNDYHRRYRGSVSNIGSSVTNYIAGVTNSGNWSKSDLTYSGSYNPYQDGNAPWASILSYDSYLINPTSSDGKDFQGLYGDGTTGFGEFDVDETGYNDEYNLAFGGNIANIVYWGVSFGVRDLYYKSTMYYGEHLNNAYVKLVTFDSNGNSVDGPIVNNATADYGYTSYLKTTGTGYNFKMGFIIKPINEFRFGFAFHTPTYFNLRDTYATGTGFEFSGTNWQYNGEKYTDDGYLNNTWYNIHTPWRFITSAAAVIGTKGIISMDYEYVGNSTMRVCDDDDNEYIDATNNIKDYFKATNIIRVGAEYRVTPQFSLRAGYSYQSTPVKDEVADNEYNITTVSTNSAYQFDNSVQYYTLGFGYRFKSAYVDMAYIHKYRQSEYHAFSPVVGYGYSEPSVYSDVKDHSNRVSLTVGFRF